MMDMTECRDRLRLACKWLTTVAQVRDEGEVGPAPRARHRHPFWTGAIRGEYRVATREWGFYCPVWHTGQAIKALVMAADILGNSYLDAAALGAEFILRNRVTDGPDRGLILAYEDHPEKVTTSAILESVTGLFALSAKTRDARWADAALDAIEWVQRNAVIEDIGLIRDLYDPAARVFVPKAFGTDGRPLMDDAAFLTAYRLTGREEYRETATTMAARLLADERPAGNWMGYAPCDRKTGAIHPRHAYWWGRPLLTLFEQSNDSRHRDLFLRSCGWYQRALRRDGGLIRNTYADFTTDSFGHATSGVGCAVLMFQDAHARLGDSSMVPWVERGLSYCMRMQFTHSRDPNLAGCILEKVLPPDGTDASPYHIRDLGTIFFAQAMAGYLASQK